jgi:hypothetical protein
MKFAEKFSRRIMRKQEQLYYLLIRTGIYFTGVMQSADLEAVSVRK